MRIKVDESKVCAGYLLTFLNDPLLGSPYVVRNAYGISTPTLTDLRSVKVPRLAVDVESVIADLMDRSVSISAKADRLENEETKLAQEQADITIGEIVSDA